MKKFVSVVASTLFFFLVIGLVILINTSQYLKKETITKTVQKISLIELSKEQTPEAKQVQNMLDTLYKKASSYGIDEKSVNAMIDSEPVKKYVGDMAASLSDYMLTGKEGPSISKAAFNEMFEKNIDQVLEAGSVDITEREKEEFKGFVMENSDEIIQNIPTVTQIATKVPASGIQSLRFFFSSSLKTGVIVGIVLCLLILVGLSYKEKKWLKYMGIPLLLASFFLFALGLTLPVIFKVLSDIFDGYIVLIFNHFLKPYAYQYIWMGLLGMVISVLFLGIYAKIKKGSKKTMEA